MLSGRRAFISRMAISGLALQSLDSKPASSRSNIRRLPSMGFCLSTYCSARRDGSCLSAAWYSELAAGARRRQREFARPTSFWRTFGAVQGRNHSPPRWRMRWRTLSRDTIRKWPRLVRLSP